MKNEGERSISYEPYIAAGLSREIISDQLRSPNKNASQKKIQRPFMSNLDNAKQAYESNSKQKQLLQNPYLDDKFAPSSKQKSHTAENRL